MILQLPAGYRRQEVLAFYGRDPLSVSELVTAGGLSKCFWNNGKPDLLEIHLDGNLAHCSLDTPVARRILGLSGNASAFEARFSSHLLLGVW